MGAWAWLSGEQEFKFTGALCAEVIRIAVFYTQITKTHSHNYEVRVTLKEKVIERAGKRARARGRARIYTHTHSHTHMCMCVYMFFIGPRRGYQRARAAHAREREGGKEGGRERDRFASGLAAPLDNLVKVQ